MSPSGKIQQLFSEIEGLTALVLGDVMIDAYYWGRVDRISPEAPVPVVQVNRRDMRLGGAANVALNIKALGAKPIVCAVVGHDEKGDVLRKIFKDHGFSTEGIIDSTDRVTTVKTRIISQGHHMLRVDEEITSPLHGTDERNLLDCVKNVLNRQKVDVIVLEDYNKGVLTPKVIETVIAWAVERNIPVTVDPKKENFLAYRNVTLFKPNLKELREGLKIEADPSDLQSLKSAIGALHAALPHAITLLTLSEYGALSASGDRFVHAHAHKREVVDVSGAGDTVIALASLVLAAGGDQQRITELSNLAGGLVCENLGVVPVDRERLISEAIKHFPQ